MSGLFDNNNMSMKRLPGISDTDSEKKEESEDMTSSSDQKNGKLVNSNGDKSLAIRQSEHTSLLNARGLSQTSAVRFHKAALIVSWISILFSIGSGVMAMVLSLRGKSESLFAYALDALLDSLSSFAVVWRFYSDDIFSASRERRACIVIGILFLVSALTLISKDIYAIITESYGLKDVKLYEWFASTCAVVSVVMATAKVYIGYKLDSRALATDSIITFVGAVTCIASVAGLEVYSKDSHLWYVDSTIGIICGVFLFFFGLRLLYVICVGKDQDKPIGNS